MKNKKAKLSTVIFLWLGLYGLQAQETVTTSGGTAYGVGGSATYTVGQVFYTTLYGSDYTISQGVQYTYYYDGIEEVKGISLYCSIYPNPTIDNLTLKIENYKSKSMSYQIYDINEKLLENKKIASSEVSIFMGNFVSATYFLNILDNNKNVKSFKIIKN